MTENDVNFKWINLPQHCSTGLAFITCTVQSSDCSDCLHILNCLFALFALFALIALNALIELIVCFAGLSQHD